MELVLRDKATANEVGLVNPETAEVLDLATCTRVQVAEWFIAMQAWKRSADEAVRTAARVYALLSDRETSLTVRVGQMKVSVPSAAKVFAADEAKLHATLLALCEAGRISEEAVNDACKPNGVECPGCGMFTPTGGYKVSKRALDALRKHDDLRDIIDLCGEWVDPSRSLKAEKA